MPALIVAFDGVLADTLGLRAEAIGAACIDEHLTVNTDTIQRVIAGRSLDEAVTYLLRERLGAHAEGNGNAGIAAPVGDTTVDLVSLRAQRHYTARLAQGITLNAAVRQQILDRSGAGYRIVIRADSLRRDVEPLLTLSDLEFHITLLRCADDRAVPTFSIAPSAMTAPARATLATEVSTIAPTATVPTATVPTVPRADSTFLRSWRTIDTRLTAMQIPPEQRRAIESSAQNAVLASAFVHVDDS